MKFEKAWTVVSRRKMIPTYITIIISVFSTVKCVLQEPLACKQGLCGMVGNDWSQACGLISDIKTWIHRKQDLVDDIYTIQDASRAAYCQLQHSSWRNERQDIVVSMGLKEGYRPALVGSLGGSGVTQSVTRSAAVVGETSATTPVVWESSQGVVRALFM